MAHPFDKLSKFSKSPRVPLRANRTRVDWTTTGSSVAEVAQTSVGNANVDSNSLNSARVQLPTREQLPSWRFRSLLFSIIVCLLLVSRSKLGHADTPAVDPQLLMLEAVEQAVWGPSIQCRVRQLSVWGNHRVQAEGRYWQAGAGTGQLKTELVYQPSLGKKVEFTQVSDGRVMWTSTGAGEGPRRVYLDQVREALGGMVRKPTAQPELSLYLALGGQAEVLRALYMRYRWVNVFAGVDEQQREVWQLVGKLRTDPPTPHAQTPFETSMFGQPPSIDTPTDVRLTLGRGTRWAYFPLKVEYFRRAKLEKDGPERLVRCSLIEHDELATFEEMPPGFFEFRVPDDVDQISDETNDYMPLNPQAILKMRLQR
jgi:hypothetical protein